MLLTAVRQSSLRQAKHHLYDFALIERYRLPVQLEEDRTNHPCGSLVAIHKRVVFRKGQRISSS
jgi:hypothetical protein